MATAKVQKRTRAERKSEAAVSSDASARGFLPPSVTPLAARRAEQRRCWFRCRCWCRRWVRTGRPPCSELNWCSCGRTGSGLWGRRGVGGEEMPALVRAKALSASAGRCSESPRCPGRRSASRRRTFRTGTSRRPASSPSSRSSGGSST